MCVRLSIVLRVVCFVGFLESNRILHIRPTMRTTTFLVQNIVGTGLPDALHSSVMVPPLRAVNWPVCGTARMLGGTVKTQRNNERGGG